MLQDAARPLVERLRIGRRNGALRAEGVEFVHQRDGRSCAESRRETILAAGSVGSPQILQLSGVGPAALLSSHGITPVHNLAGVGENLHDHLQIRMQYKVSNTVTLNDRVDSVFGKIAMAAEYTLFKTGPLTMPPSQLGAWPVATRHNRRPTSSGTCRHDCGKRQRHDSRGLGRRLIRLNLSQ